MEYGYACLGVEKNTKKRAREEKETSNINR